MSNWRANSIRPGSKLTMPLRQMWFKYMKTAVNYFSYARVMKEPRRKAACRRLPQRHREASAPLRFPDLYPYGEASYAQRLP